MPEVNWKQTAIKLARRAALEGFSKQEKTLEEIASDLAYIEGLCEHIVELEKHITVLEENANAEKTANKPNH